MSEDGRARPGVVLPPEVPATLDRELKDDRYATTARVRLHTGGLAIWKRSVVVLPPGVRAGAAARHLADREADHLERLADVDGVPGLIARPTADSLLREWVPGADVRALDRVPDRVFPALRELVAAIHARGTAYADLAKEDNVVVEDDSRGDAGRPWLVDFQISVARGTLLGPLVPLLQRADRYHLARHVLRRRPDQLSDADRAALATGRSWLRRLHRVLLKKPYNLLTRRVVRRWSGAGEGRRTGEPRGLRERR